MKNKLLFIFLDGIGLGEHNETNPFTVAHMPALFDLIGEELTNGIYIKKEQVLVKGIDACLGIEGVPQSATGQTSLFTGFNAQAILGYHLLAYPNDELIKLINQRSIFKYAKELGLKSTFANSYTEGFFKSFDLDATNYSVTTRCVLAAKDEFRTINDLNQGKAVHWDITNFTLQEIPENKTALISPFLAGERLKNLTNDFDVIVYECFLPDLIGHRKDMEKAVTFLENLDEFLCGILKDKPEDVHVLISSDHGNMEDLTYGGHSKNEVPLIVIGKEATVFDSVTSIDQIFNAIFTKLFA